MKTENLRHAEALKKAQSAPNTIVQERDQLRIRIREVLGRNRTLQEENANLGTKIEELSDEVISSRVLIDKLLKTSHETQVSDWEMKEAQYKAAIRNYQQQIRKQGSTVSLELYRAVVDDSKRTQSQLLDATRKITDLESKVLSLETAEVPIGGGAKTPNPNKGEVVSFFSPTDYLEKGLLFRDFYRKSPEALPTLLAKKSKTPVSDGKRSLDLDIGYPTTSTKKSHKTKSYRTPIEKMRLRGISDPEDDSRDLEQPMETKLPEDLIGMTISFDTPVGGLPSPQKDEHVYMKKWVDVNAAKLFMAPDKEARRSALTRHDPKISILSPIYKVTQSNATEVEPTKCTTLGNKENEPRILSPKSASKALRMQKARELGGMKGLKSHLNKIRSPQPLGKPQRVALARRSVNYY
jgi:hypothetical protein